MKTLKQVEAIDAICEEQFKDLEITEAEYQGKKVKLNDPIRGGSKKFYVYVKDGDKVKKVSFGDTTGLSIKRDDPARRKSFRARHNCDNPGPKTKARYWSCFQWRAKSPVNNENEPEIGRRLTFKESLKDK
jgi:hypothetical protein